MMADLRHVTSTDLPAASYVKDCPRGVRTIDVMAYLQPSTFQQTAFFALSTTSWLSPNTFTTVARVMTTHRANTMMLVAFFFTVAPV